LIPPVFSAGAATKRRKDRERIVSDNDFGSLTEFFNSLVGALENPQDDPELAEIIEQALQEDAERTSSGEVPSPGGGNQHKTKAREPANLGEHLVAAVGKAEEISSGKTDDGGDHTDEDRDDKADRGISVPSNNGATSRQASRSHLFAGDRRKANQAGQRVAAQLIQTIAKVA
jgi:hypothetical protein